MRSDNDFTSVSVIDSKTLPHNSAETSCSPEDGEIRIIFENQNVCELYNTTDGTSNIALVKVENVSENSFNQTCDETNSSWEFRQFYTIGEDEEIANEHLNISWTASLDTISSVSSLLSPFSTTINEDTIISEHILQENTSPLDVITNGQVNTIARSDDIDVISHLTTIENEDTIASDNSNFKEIAALINNISDDETLSNYSYHSTELTVPLRVEGNENSNASETSSATTVSSVSELLSHFYTTTSSEKNLNFNNIISSSNATPNGDTIIVKNLKHEVSSTNHDAFSRECSNHIDTILNGETNFSENFDFNEVNSFFNTITNTDRIASDALSNEITSSLDPQRVGETIPKSNTNCIEITSPLDSTRNVETMTDENLNLSDIISLCDATTNCDTIANAILNCIEVITPPETTAIAETIESASLNCNDVTSTLETTINDENVSSETHSNVGKGCNDIASPLEITTVDETIATALLQTTVYAETIASKIINLSDFKSKLNETKTNGETIPGDIFNFNEIRNEEKNNSESSNLDDESDDISSLLSETNEVTNDDENNSESFNLNVETDEGLTLVDETTEITNDGKSNRESLNFNNKPDEVSSLVDETNEITNVEKNKSESLNLLAKSDEVSSLVDDTNEIANVENNCSESLNLLAESDEVSSLVDDTNEIANVENNCSESLNLLAESDEVSSFVDDTNEIANVENNCSESLNLLAESDEVSSLVDETNVVIPNSSKTKKHFCIFCKTLQTKISRHILHKHKSEKQVKAILKLPNKHKDRIKMLNQLRKNGNFLHNTNKSLNTGVLIVSRQKEVSSNNEAGHYICCKNCQGFFSKRTIRLHLRKCGITEIGSLSKENITPNTAPAKENFNAKCKTFTDKRDSAISANLTDCLPQSTNNEQIDSEVVVATLIDLLTNDEDISAKSLNGNELTSHLDTANKGTVPGQNSNTNNTSPSKIEENAKAGNSHLDITKITIPFSGKTKKHFCIFCKTLQSNIARHLLHKHRMETQVKDILKLPKKHKDRLKVINQLRKEGDFLHNTTKSLNTGMLILSRRKQANSTNGAEDYVCCKNCKGFFSKQTLRIHLRKCGHYKINDRTNLIASRRLTQYMHESASEILRTEIFPLLQVDKITKAIRYDDLIIKYGNEMAGKCTHASQHDFVRSKLRLLGRFKIAIQELCPAVEALKDVFQPQMINNCTKALRKIASWDNSSKRRKTSSQAYNLNSMIQKCGNLQRTAFNEMQKDVLVKNLDEFMILWKEELLEGVRKDSNELDDARTSGVEKEPILHEDVEENSNSLECSKPNTSDEITKHLEKTIPSENLNLNKTFLPESRKDLEESASHFDITKVVVPLSSKTKKHFCVFCKTLQTKISRHLLHKHRSEKQVRHILELPKKHKDRLRVINQLRKEGDFLHNTTKSLNTGMLILSRQKHAKSKNEAKDYVCCKNCKGFFSKQTLRAHFRRCGHNKKNYRTFLEANRRLTRYIHESANEILKTEIFPLLQVDKITKTIRYDDLIIKYGNEMAEKCTQASQHDFVRSMLRLLGRFKIAIKELCPEVETLKEVFQPHMFNFCRKALRKIASWDNSLKQCKTASRASNLESIIKKCGNLQRAEFMQMHENVLIKNLDEFMVLWKREILQGVNIDCNEINNARTSDDEKKKVVDENMSINAVEGSNSKEFCKLNASDEITKHLEKTTSSESLPFNEKFVHESQKDLEECASHLDITKVEIPLSSKTKKHFCTFCKTLQTKISRHLLTKHRSEKQVKDILKLPKKHKDRLKVINQLRKEGDFLHNTTKSLNTGMLILSRQKHAKSKNEAKDYVCCKNCKGFFSKQTLRAHFRRCGHNKKNYRTILEANRRLTRYIHESANEILKTEIFVYENMSINAEEGSNSKEFCKLNASDEITKHLEKTTSSESLPFNEKFVHESQKDLEECASHLDITKVEIPLSSKTKKHFCTFCKTLQTKISRHLLTKHRSEKQVKDILKLPKKHKDRLKVINQLRKEGDFLHNTTKSLNTGMLILSRQKHAKSKNEADDYVCCKNCKGFFSKQTLRAHLRRCGHNKINDRTNLIESRRLTQYIHESANETLKTEIFPLLKLDKITKVIRYDGLIIKYGNEIAKKCVSADLRENLRSKLRLLGRFKIAVNVLCPEVKELKQVFNPQLFKPCMEAFRKTANWDTALMWFKTPSVALSLSSIMKKCGRLQGAEFKKTEENVLSENLNEFLFLWDKEISKIVYKRDSEDMIVPKENAVVGKKAEEDPQSDSFAESSSSEQSPKKCKIREKRETRSRFSKIKRLRWTQEEKNAVISTFGCLFELEKLPSLQECTDVINKFPILKHRTPPQIKSWIDNQRSKTVGDENTRKKVDEDVDVAKSDVNIISEEIPKNRIATRRRGRDEEETPWRFSKIKRLRWTQEEQEAIISAFGCLKKLERLPSLAECIGVINKFPILKNRTPPQVKSWIDNQRSKNVVEDSVRKKAEEIVKADTSDEGSVSEEMPKNRRASKRDRREGRKDESPLRFSKIKRIRWTQEEQDTIIATFGCLKDLDRLPSLMECTDAVNKFPVLKNRTAAQLKSWIDNQRRYK